MTKTSAPARAHRPQPYTVFGAAIVAGAAAAFGLNSALDTHLAQARPQVESESILVALRALPAGAPVTVWDVGLRDWPKAMVPSSAMRVTDDLDNLVVRHPLREGQPILAVQLGRVDTAVETVARPLAVAAPPAPATREPERDLWESTPTASIPPAQTPPATSTVTTPPVATTVTTVSTSFATRSTTPPPAPVTAETATPAVDPVPPATPAAVAGSAARPEPSAPTEAVVAPPIAATEPVVRPQAPEDRPIETVASADEPIAPMAPRTTVEATPPAADTAIAPSAPVRTALRPRSSVIQALSVPNRSALSGDAGDQTDDALPGAVANRATALTAVKERSVTVSNTSDTPPRMLPSAGDTAAPAAATAQAPRAPQSRTAPTRGTAAPTTRSARAQGFSKGYRPN